VRTIAPYAFFSCVAMTTLTLPAAGDLTDIGDFAFCDCDSLESIAIPENVSSIGRGAFSYSTYLAQVTIPSSIETIDSGAFVGNPSLAEVIVNAVNPPALGDDVFAENAAGRLVKVPGPSLQDYRDAADWDQLDDSEIIAQ
jgi:hypothetical protein